MKLFEILDHEAWLKRRLASAEHELENNINWLSRQGLKVFHDTCPAGYYAIGSGKNLLGTVVYNAVPSPVSKQQGLLLKAKYKRNQQLGAMITKLRSELFLLKRLNT